MSILSEIQRISNNVEKMKNKLNSQGFVCDNLDKLASIIETYGAKEPVRPATLTITTNSTANLFYLNQSGNFVQANGTSFKNIKTFVGELIVLRTANESCRNEAITGAKGLINYNGLMFFKITGTSVQIVTYNSGAAD